MTAKRIDGRVRIEVRKDGMMLARLTPATLISYAMLSERTLAHLGPVFREMHKISFPYDIVTVIVSEWGEEFEHVETITEESDE